MWRALVRKAEEVDFSILLLFAGMIFFTGILIFVEWRFNDDAQVFQVIASLVSGFGGAFFGLMKAKAEPAKPAPPPAEEPHGTQP